jgi:hypothetical protein
LGEGVVSPDMAKGNKSMVNKMYNNTGDKVPIQFHSYHNEQSE